MSSKNLNRKTKKKTIKKKEENYSKFTSKIY